MQSRRHRFQHKKPTVKSTNQPITLTINALTHEGRGVAVYDESHGKQYQDRWGKKIFVDFALPDETVQAIINTTKKSFDEGESIQVITPSADRQPAICQHFGVCGGCNLQHLHADKQLAHKQQTLANHLNHFANTTPDVWLTPVVGERTGYRTKARMGVRYVTKKDAILVGFRERASNFLTDISDCPILDTRINAHLTTLKDTLWQLDGKDDITHLEFAAGDDCSSVAMIVRHTSPLSQHDQDALIAFCQNVGWQLFLQPKSSATVHRIDGTDGSACSLTVPPTGGLFYHLADFDITFEFSPLDFTQVNLSVNRQMIQLACDLLDLQKGERVLDLFCGLGNFSLPLAKMVGETGFVVGVEGSAEMTERATMNAQTNGLHQTRFYVQDLTQDFSHQPWATGENTFDALLIDPPRSGAAEVMAYLGKFNAKRIVYVSCNPATLARDTALLLEQGYRLTHAGVMDMFCHTGHVESIARFEKI